MRASRISFDASASHFSERQEEMAATPVNGACIALNEDALERLLDGPLQNLQPVFVPLAELHGAAVF